MPAHAVKCTVCESFQDWRRSIPVNTTVLALLTALVSVIGATAPPLAKLVKGDYSHVVVKWAHDDTTGGVVLAAVNQGPMPASITTITLVVPLKSGRQSFVGYVSPDAKKIQGDDEWFVKPYGNKAIHATFYTDAIKEAISERSFTYEPCQILIEATEFAPERFSLFPSTNEPIKVDCTQLSILMGRQIVQHGQLPASQTAVSAPLTPPTRVLAPKTDTSRHKP